MIFGGKVLKKLWYWIELEMYDIVELMMLLDMVVKDLQGQYDWVRLVGGQWVNVVCKMVERMNRGIR